MAGCRSKEPFSFVPVTGKITYSDKTPIPADEIMVRLVPLEPARNGTDVAGAATGYADGKSGVFDGVTTHKPNDGVVPGRYRVMVVPMKDHEPNKALAAKYFSPTESPLVIEVTRDKHDFPDLHVDKP